MVCTVCRNVLTKDDIVVDTDRQHMVGGLFYELVMVSECLENKKRIV